MSLVDAHYIFVTENIQIIMLLLIVILMALMIIDGVDNDGEWH